MKMGVELLYPKGSAHNVDTYFGAAIAPRVQYARMADMVGGYGETVEDPAEIVPALNRAFKAMKKGRPAILDVIIDDEMKFLGPMLSSVWKDEE